MTARLLDGGDTGVCGVLTSGGTESIIVIARAHRNFFREVLLMLVLTHILIPRREDPFK